MHKQNGKNIGLIQNFNHLVFVLGKFQQNFAKDLIYKCVTPGILDNISFITEEHQLGLSRNIY